MPKRKTELLPCPRCGTVPRMEYSERMEFWWQYGKKGTFASARSAGCSEQKGVAAVAERKQNIFAKRDAVTATGRRRVENEKRIYGL